MSKESIDLDAIDFQILDEIQKDGRISMEKLSEKLTIKKSATYSRIKKMEDQQVITGYQAVVDPVKVGQDLEMIIKVKARYDKGYHRVVGEKLAKIPGVYGVYFVFGDDDFIILARGRNRASLIEKIEHTMEMKEVERTSSYFVAEVIKFTPSVDVKFSQS